MFAKLKLLLFAFFVLAIGNAHAQLWSGILSPSRAIDWSTAGVPGGIPSASWTQSGSTIAAGASTSTIQAALNSCGTNHYVLLGAGTFNVTNLNIPSNCELRGSGTLTTILNTTGSGSVFTLGSGGPNYSSPASTTITCGATAGSTSLCVSSASGISTGTLLAISELNDPSYVTINGADGTCSWCDGTGDGGIRARGQIVLVTAVSGTTLTFSPALYTAYGAATGTSPALAYYFSPGAVHAGITNLQVYANGTGYSEVYRLTACEYCWVKGVFDNYTDGDHAKVLWGFHDEIRDSYFSNAYIHAPGSIDSDIFLINKTTGTLIENNIFERLHVGVMFGWGAAGNVVGYNYDIGNFDSSATIVNFAGIDYHGAHPQFNLQEGNVVNQITMDSFWGSGSNNTNYRNHLRGTDTLASPRASGRNVVNWSSTVFATQQMMGEQLAFPYTNINSVGNVHGSTDAVIAAIGGEYNTGSSPFTSTIVPSAYRAYDNFFSAISVGYSTGNDLTGSAAAGFNGGYWIGKAIESFFQHGNFDIASGSVIWDGVTTHTLPASFYLSSKPGWFGSITWPPIGPDVTGGNVDNSVLAGHVYAIPAEFCYNNTARDSNGLKKFDPNVCYAFTAGGPSISTSSLPGATQNSPYTTTLAASGGTTPYTWSITVGSLPTGLSLNSSTGVISGTPTVAGTSSFTVHLLDAGALTDNKALSITVSAIPTTVGAPTGRMP